MGPLRASRNAKRAKLKRLPPELYELAMNGGAKPWTIRRYKELFAECGDLHTRTQIKWENWFRRNWHRRHQLPRELRESMESL